MRIDESGAGVRGVKAGGAGFAVPAIALVCSVLTVCWFAAFVPLASASGGAFYGWGQGQGLGDGLDGYEPNPEAINLVPGVDPTVITGGYNASLAIGSDGALYAWGDGEGGGGAAFDALGPELLSLAEGVKPLAIATGEFHSLAIGSDHQLYAWGGNGAGEVGNGTTVPQRTPAAVTLAEGVTPAAIAAGYEASLAIGSDGHEYGWGVETAGYKSEIGSPQVIERNLGSEEHPEWVPFDASAVAVGGSFFLAIGTDGQLYSWGDSSDGGLGDGEIHEGNRPSPEPVTLAPGVTPVAISAGLWHGLAIGSDHKLYGWGYNAVGEVGNGTTGQVPSPEVIALAPGVSPTAISAGANFSLAIGSDGRLYSWGYNGFGELGNGGGSDEPSPKPVSLPPWVTPISVVAGGGAAHMTVSGSAAGGGTITLKKSTALYGHYVDKISGAGWTVHGDSEVTLHECGTTYYTASSCDRENALSVVLGTGKKAGTFKNSLFKLQVGPVGHHEDPCGITGAYTCYIVAVGNTGDETTSGPLTFKLPSATVKLGMAVPNGYTDAVKAANFPAGDTIIAQECDSTVNPAANLGTSCDPGTEISGKASKSGKVKFTPKGVTVKDGEGYEESGSGACPPGGTCSIVVSDGTTRSVAAVIPITLAP